MPPEPSRLRRATTAVRRWASRSVWRALGLVVGLGTVAGLAFGFGTIGPSWAQIVGWIVFVTLAVVVVSWVAAPSWQRAVVGVLFFAPMVAIVAVIGPASDAALAPENGHTMARRVGGVQTRTGGCAAVYDYAVDSTAYRSVMSPEGCPPLVMVEYAVPEPWRVRPQPEGVAPPPAPPPGVAR